MSTYVVYPNQEQEKVMKAFMEALEISFVKEDDTVPPYVLAGIARAREDVKAGRVMSKEEVRRRLSSPK
jgi:hypothetical protein